MRTIRPLTDPELFWLAVEEQSEWQGHLLPRRIVDRLTLDDSLLNLLVEGLEGPCWVASGWSSGNGYAKLSVSGRSQQLHRVVFRLLVGEISHGLVLDHRCGCRRCCNPRHLGPETVRDNPLLGNAVLFQPNSFFAAKLDEGYTERGPKAPQ